MLQGGEDAHLVAEAADRLRVEPRAVDDLQRHAPAEVLAPLLGEEDPAHAAAADLAQDAVGTDGLRQRLRGGLPRRLVEDRARGRFAGRQELGKLPGEVGIAPFDFAQETAARLAGEPAGALVELRQLLAPHRAPWRRSSRSSQARA